MPNFLIAVVVMVYSFTKIGSIVLTFLLKRSQERFRRKVRTIEMRKALLRSLQEKCDSNQADLCEGGVEHDPTVMRKLA
ncbi:hypothetical protein NL676_001701 [Syzygium grande]|nr:hypothetical protein NL676_001701 [Syzygium grande]